VREGALPADELLERSTELALLGEAFAEVEATASGRMVLVRGEAGVGKTVLTRGFCAGLPARTRVLWAACEPLFTPRPYGPLLDPARVVGGELEEILEQDRTPHDVALALIRELEGGRATVLVLEDLHWADDATLDVVRLLARRIAPLMVLLVATYRDDELTRAHPLRVLLGELPSSGSVLRLDLANLSRDAVARLAASADVDAEQLYERTAGNPFFVTEVLAGGSGMLPETVRDAVLARLARSSERARVVMDAVAVVPPRAELWLLEALTGESFGALGECLASGMLRRQEDGVAYRHELARVAVEASIEPDRALHLHRAVLGALEAPPAGAPDAARLAHHAQSAGDVEAVLRYAPAAGDQAAASRSHREAAAQYARALRYGDQLPVEKRAELFSRRAAECMLTDQLDAALAAQEEALRCYRQIGERAGEGGALRGLARLRLLVSWSAGAEELAAEAIKLLEEGPPGHELAMAYATVANARMNLEDSEGTVAWGNRALAVAEAIGDIEAELYGLTFMGAAELRSGDDAGLRKLEHALELALEHDLEEAAGRALMLLMSSLLGLRRLEHARANLERGLRYSTERGLETQRAYFIAGAGRIALADANWQEAETLAQQTVRDPRGVPLPRVWGLVVLGLLRARRGDPGGSELLDEAEEIVRPTGQLEWIGMVASAKAESAWLDGTPQRVEELTHDAAALARERHHAWSGGELAYWRWKSGVKEGDLGTELAEPYARAIAGDWRGAAASWRDLGHAYEAALALGDGDDPEALRASVASLQDMGAKAVAAVVARRGRELGVRRLPRGPRSQTRENSAGLTPREVEVVGFLVEGLRNPDIAERMVVSQRTVDHHVSAILRKLGVRHRGEVRGAAERLGLVPERPR
jgi:DNA-binding CsgD family transcriptional regulator/tetratricopeptide (TPR) repeat protein